MKKILISLLYLLISLSLNAQLIKETKPETYFKLKKIGNHGFNQFIKTKDSIETYRKLNAGEIKSKIIKDAVLNFKTNVVSDIILKEDTDVVVLNYNNGFYEIQADSSHGYIKKDWILVSEDMELLLEIKEEEEGVKKLKLETEEAERAKIRAEKEEKLKEKDEKKRIALTEQKYIKKYGIKVYKKLKDGYIWLGMTKDMALISLGKPDDINRTVGSWGVNEQWVYGRNYYYFENGKLTSYQD